MNAPEPDPPRTPTKLTGNGGAGRVDPDEQMDSESDDSNVQQSASTLRRRSLR